MRNYVNTKACSGENFSTTLKETAIIEADDCMCKYEINKKARK